jgi:hypothetical protein
MISEEYEAPVYDRQSHKKHTGRLTMEDSRIGQICVWVNHLLSAQCVEMLQKGATLVKPENP